MINADGKKDNEKRLAVYSILEYNSLMSQWMLQYSEQFIRDMKRLLKRYPRETKQILLNMDIYKDELEKHNNPLLLNHFSFVHRETSGCHAITQQPVKSAA